MCCRRCIDLVRERVQIRNAQIAHRRFERLMSEHVLNRAHGNALRFPIAGTRLAKTVQVVVLADRMHFAGCLDLPRCVISASGPRSGTISAVHARSKRDALKLSKEVVIRATVLVDEYPTRMRCMLFPVAK